MLTFLTNTLRRLVALIEVFAERESVKARKALQDAAVLVQKASGHRTAAKDARVVVAAVKSTVAPAPAEITGGTEVDPASIPEAPKP